MTNKEIIQQAIDLISDPNKWTKNALARDKYNNKLINSNSPEAVCWCAVGAIRKCCGMNRYYNLINELESYCLDIHDNTLENINDFYGREKAIEAMQEYLKTYGNKENY